MRNPSDIDHATVLCFLDSFLKTPLKNVSKKSGIIDVTPAFSLDARAVPIRQSAVRILGARKSMQEQGKSMHLTFLGGWAIKQPPEVPKQKACNVSDSQDNPSPKEEERMETWVSEWLRKHSGTLSFRWSLCRVFCLAPSSKALARHKES